MNRGDRAADGVAVASPLEDHVEGLGRIQYARGLRDVEYVLNVDGLDRRVSDGTPRKRFSSSEIRKGVSRLARGTFRLLHGHA